VESIKDLDEASQLIEITRIINEFIIEDAPLQINLDSIHRNKIINEKSLESLQYAKKLVLNLLRDDVFPRFLQSDEIKTLIAAANEINKIISN